MLSQQKIHKGTAPQEIFGRLAQKQNGRQTREKSRSKCKIEFPFQKMKSHGAKINIKGDMAVFFVEKTKSNRLNRYFKVI